MQLTLEVTPELMMRLTTLAQSEAVPVEEWATVALVRLSEKRASRNGDGRTHDNGDDTGEEASQDTSWYGMSIREYVQKLRDENPNPDFERSLVPKRERSSLEFGAVVPWDGTDAQEYVKELRKEWDHRP